MLLCYGTIMLLSHRAKEVTNMPNQSAAYNTATEPFDASKPLANNKSQFTAQTEGPQTLATVRDARKLARLVEKDKLRHNIRREQSEELTSFNQPGGFEKRLEKYMPNDGEYESPVMNFLMSSDPLSGVSQMIEDQATYGATIIKDDLRYKKTNLQVRNILKGRDMSASDAKALGEIITNESRYGTQAMDSARSTYFFRKQGAKDPDYQPL